MKKLIFLFVAALLISGAVWAQLPPPPFTATPGSALGTLEGFDVSAVDTVSTESRYSAGIFGNYIDDYLDVNFYDPTVRTFGFLGGYPATSPVTTTDNLGGTDLSLGFAQAFQPFYLGVYYGGTLGEARDIYDADGGTVNAETAPSDKTWSRWNSKLALLVGTSGFGAFRLDMILGQRTDSTAVDGEFTSKIRDETTPSLALTWGGIQLAGLDPYVKLNYKFANKTIWGAYVGTSYYDMTQTSGSFLGVEAGINYDLDETSSVSAALLVGGQFGQKTTGTGTAPGVVADTPSYDDKAGGILGFGLEASYKKTLDFGTVAFGFKPVIHAGYTVDNTADTSSNVGGASTDVDVASNNRLEAAVAMNLGLKFQATQKIALYTGAGFQLFDYRYLSHSGGDTKNEDSAWTFDGFAWDPETLSTGGRLGFGMTVTPIENLVVGAGLTSLLDKFVVINLANMTVGSGSFWGNTNPNFAGYIGNIFTGLTFDLTVSYKF